MKKQKKKSRKKSRKSKLDQLIVIAAAILLASILSEAPRWKEPVDSHEAMHPQMSQDQPVPQLVPPAFQIERFSTKNLPPHSIPTRGRY